MGIREGAGVEGIKGEHPLLPEINIHEH